MTDPQISAEAHLGAAISALGEDGFTAHLYQWLGQCFEVDNVTILAFFQTRQPEIFFHHAKVSHVHEKLESDYLSFAYLLDPFHELHVMREPEGLYRLRDFAPDQFKRIEYFAKYYARTTLIDEIAYVAYPARGVSVHVCLGRDASSRRMFSAADMRTAQNLSAIVCSLIRKQWQNLSASGDYTDDSLVTRVRARLASQHDIHLSPRQCETALLILRGHSTMSISLRLNISAQTVKVFRKQLYRRCKISSQAELFSLITPILT